MQRPAEGPGAAPRCRRARKAPPHCVGAAAASLPPPSAFPSVAFRLSVLDRAASTCCVTLSLVAASRPTASAACGGGPQCRGSERKGSQGGGGWACTGSERKAHRGAAAAGLGVRSGASARGQPHTHSPCPGHPPPCPCWRQPCPRAAKGPGRGAAVRWAARGRKGGGGAGRAPSRRHGAARRPAGWLAHAAGSGWLAAQRRGALPQLPEIRCFTLLISMAAAAGVSVVPVQACCRRREWARGPPRALPMSPPHRTLGAAPHQGHVWENCLASLFGQD